MGWTPGSGKKQARRSAFAVEARRVEVAKLYLQRKTQREIAAILGVSQTVVFRDIKAAEAHMRGEAADALWLRKQRILADIDIVRQEALAAYERSKQERVTKRVEQETVPSLVPGEKPTVRVQRAVQTSEATTGDTRHLEVVLKANAEESKLLGHYAAEKAPADEGQDDYSALSVDELWALARDMMNQLGGSNGKQHLLATDNDSSEA